jgi:hypothetical protein
MILSLAGPVGGTQEHPVNYQHVTNALQIEGEGVNKGE